MEVHGRLKSKTYKQAVTHWWATAYKWPGLAVTMEDHSARRAIGLEVTLAALLRFLGNMPDQPVNIVLPHNGTDASAHFGAGGWRVKCEMSWELAHAIIMEQQGEIKGGVQTEE